MAKRITEAFEVRELPGLGRGGRPCVQLRAPLEYRVGSADSPETIIVPHGFVTDFASVPWGLWNLFPPLGIYARPAIIHDFLYATGGQGDWDGLGPFQDGRYLTGPLRKDVAAPSYSRAEADAVFREAMAVVGVAPWRREVMYRAVWLGGGSGWDRG
ncbi:MAG: DUF1353 domain-containing protein [Pseudomonadota bacterium]